MNQHNERWSLTREQIERMATAYNLAVDQVTKFSSVASETAEEREANIQVAKRAWHFDILAMLEKLGCPAREFAEWEATIMKCANQKKYLDDSEPEGNA